MKSRTSSIPIGLFLIGFFWLARGYQRPEPGEINKTYGDAVNKVNDRYILANDHDFAPVREEAEKFIAAGGDLNWTNSQGDTLLLMAILNNDMGLCRSVLAKSRTSVNTPDAVDETPLLHAVEQKQENTELVKLLLDYGANPNLGLYDKKLRRSPLGMAVYKGYVNSARLLMDKGADINEHVGEGNSPLHMAVMLGNVQIVRLLLEHGAVQRKNDHGETPLRIAQRLQHRQEHLAFDELVSLLKSTRQ
jgi:ankyrin repeat protein